uniref:F-box domain-containing protein n=1 Tax=Globodera pallida TaxID=36090 RepID=A0A183C3J7_GLOPA
MTSICTWVEWLRTLCWVHLSAQHLPALLGNQFRPWTDGQQQQQRRHRELFICGDIWLGVFTFIGPAELGLKLALISWRFDGLVDTHFKTRKWSLGELKVRRSISGIGAQIVKRVSACQFERFPLPQQPPPASLVAFKKIIISFLDHTVVDFLRRLQHLFDERITLALDMDFTCDQNPNWDFVERQIWPLLTVDSISKMRLNCHAVMQLRKRFSPTILRDCANLRLIRTDGHCFPYNFGRPDDRIKGTSSYEALFKWLHTPREDGRPRVTKCQPFIYNMREVNQLKEPFELENGLTHEHLSFRHVRDTLWLLTRGPIAARDALKWTEWEREAVDDWEENNLLVFAINGQMGPITDYRNAINNVLARFSCCGCLKMNAQNSGILASVGAVTRVNAVTVTMRMPHRISLNSQVHPPNIMK